MNGAVSGSAVVESRGGGTPFSSAASCRSRSASLTPMLRNQRSSRSDSNPSSRASRLRKRTASRRSAGGLLARSRMKSITALRRCG